MRTEPFVFDVTVTGFISGFICAPQMLKFYTFGGGAVSLLGGAGPTRGTGNSNTELPTKVVHSANPISVGIRCGMAVRLIVGM